MHPGDRYAVVPAPEAGRRVLVRRDPPPAARAGEGPVVDGIVLEAQFALPDGGTIQLSATVEDGLVHIEFTDDGPGVPASVIDALSSGQSVQSTKLSGNAREGIHETLLDMTEQRTLLMSDIFNAGEA